MKQKTIAILLTIALLAGCNTPAPAAPSAAEPDMEAIIQQSVDEAVKERLEQIEEEQRKKDEEIAKLKEQLEELTSQQEAPPEERSSAPAENASSQTPASSQPAAPASSSQAGVPPQPEPEPPPQSVPAPTAKQPAKTKLVNEGTIFEGYEVKVNDWTTPATSSGGKDWPISTWYFWGPGETVLGSISGSAMDKISRKYAASTNYDPDIDWSTWYADAFNEYRNVAGGGSISSDGSASEEEPDEGENSQQAGTFLKDDALEVIRLVNEERAKQGLEPLDVDENLMELARIRAEELEGKFSHERPDGTHIAQTFSGGENIAGDHPSPSAVMEAWMDSEGHRNNILRERFRYIGVGCYQDANGDLYWVQLFSPRKT